jgi:hypothetical protein
MGDYFRLCAGLLPAFGTHLIGSFRPLRYSDASGLSPFVKARHATILRDNGLAADHDSDKRLGALCGFRLRYWNMADDGWRLTRRSAVPL